MYLLRGGRLVQAEAAVGATGVALMAKDGAMGLNERLGLGKVESFKGSAMTLQFDGMKPRVMLYERQFVALFGVEGAPLTTSLIGAVELYQSSSESRDMSGFRELVVPALAELPVIAQTSAVQAVIQAPAREVETLKGVKIPRCIVNGCYVPQEGELLELQDGSKIKVVRRGNTVKEFVAVKPRGRKEFVVEATTVNVPAGIPDIGKYLEIKGRIGAQRPFTLFNVRVRRGGGKSPANVRVNVSKLQGADPYYVSADVQDLTAAQKALIMVAVGLLGPDGTWHEHA